MSYPAASYDISITKAYLTGAAIEGPLLGISVAMYAAYVRMLSKSSSPYTKIFTGVATLQLTVSIAHYTMSIIQLTDGILRHSGSTPGALDKWFADPTRPMYVALISTYVTNMVLADQLLAWRCYVVWGQSRKIGACFLCLCVIAFVLSYISCAGFATLKRTDAPFVNFRYTAAALALSVTIQTAATSAIVWKIYHTSAWRYRVDDSKERLGHIWIIVESGALLAVSSATVLGLFLLNMNVCWIMTCFVAQISFMVPTSIIIRARIKQSQGVVQAISLPGLHPDRARPNRDVIERGSPSTVRRSTISVTRAVSDASHKIEHVA